jgi:hypothetical protein
MAERDADAVAKLATELGYPNENKSIRAPGHALFQRAGKRLSRKVALRRVVGNW